MEKECEGEDGPRSGPHRRGVGGHSDSAPYLFLGTPARSCMPKGSWCDGYPVFLTPGRTKSCHEAKAKGCRVHSQTHQCHDVVGQVSGKIWGNKTGQASQRNASVVLAGAAQVLEREGGGSVGRCRPGITGSWPAVWGCACRRGTEHQPVPDPVLGEPGRWGNHRAQRRTVSAALHTDAAGRPRAKTTSRA